MSSKRYVVFANPPTVEELRATSSYQDEETELAWETIKILHPRESTSSTSQLISRHQEKHPHPIPSLTGLHSPTGDNYYQGLVNSSNGGPPNHALQPKKRVRLSDRSDDEKTRDLTHDKSALDNEKTNASMDSISMDYFQTQLDYHDSFGDDSVDVTVNMASPSDGTSCLLSHTQSIPPSLASTKSSKTNRANSQLPSQQTSYSESMVVNPPQWHFDARSCTPLDRITLSSHSSLYSILFHLTQKTPLTTIELKKPRKNGSSTAHLAHFDCMDDSGTSIKLALWDEVAESLDSVCLAGDIIYLSGIATSYYQGKLQASSTRGSRAQICYRLRPTHQSHLQTFCPDLRLAYDPTTRRVKELLDWAKRVLL